MKQGQSISFRTARIKYDPEWSQSKPFQVFYNGSANGSFETLSKALAYFGPSAKLYEWSDWK